MEPILQKRIYPALWRIRIRRLSLALTAIWSLAALVALAMWAFNREGQFDPTGWPPILFWTTAVATLLAIPLVRLIPLTPQQVITAIERMYPDLDATLMTAAAIEPPPGQRLGFLQMDVLRKAVTHSYQNSWSRVIPGWQLLTVPLAGLIGLAAFFAALMALMLNPLPLPEDPTIPFGQAVVDPQQMVLEIEPGNTEVERGSSLLVLARFPRAVPTEATLVAEDEAGQEWRLPMAKSLDDPVFAARLAAVEAPLRYFVEYDGLRSEAFQIGVFEIPLLVRADAHLRYPAYTGLPPRTIQDVRRLRAVEGTEVTFDFYVNKSLAGAELQAVDEGDSLSLQVDDQDPRRYHAAWTLTESRKFEVRLLDAEGRSNRTPPRLTVSVTANEPPKLKVLKPGRDLEASPLEEILMSAEARDDFAVQAMGLSYQLAGQEAHDLELTMVSGKLKWQEVQHLLALESLGAQPDDLVTYSFWAEDEGPGGQRRRVFSDLYFLEIRPFEEIFREGQNQPEGASPPPSQGQPGAEGGGQQALELAELQKQILNATWNLRRRETSTQVSDPFAADVQTLVESQQSARAQLAQLAGELNQAGAETVVESIDQAMLQAVESLQEAADASAASPLDEALLQQQSAYQGLLRLRARESEVRQQSSPPQSGAASGNSRSQQQLNQLELKQDRNRYEAERTAASPQEANPQEQQNQEVLDRLKELARRQEDLNERIKDLVAALAEAQSPEEQEELDRQLKSLRDQQQQMLRDTEQLLDQMQSPENQESMESESRQLSQTRDNLQQASESLQQGQVSQAAAEGTRAQRELESLRDEFKNRTAEQFTEQMRQMRNRAQEIERNQESIAQQMQQESGELPEGLQRPEERRAGPPSLREETAEQLDLDQELARQREAVEQLRQEIRDTVEAAEDIEPLLAEALYQTYRDTEVSRPEEALEATRRSLARGWQRDADQQQERAQEGIRQLREGISQAAEQVLGDETEALRAAQRALENLNRDLSEELRQAGERPEAESDREEAAGSRPEASAGEPSPTESAGQGQNPGSADDSPAGQRPPNPGAEQKPGGRRPPGGEQPGGEQPGGEQAGGNQPGENEADPESPTAQDSPRQTPPEDNGDGQPAGQPGQGDRRSANPDGQPSTEPGQGGSRGDNLSQLLEQFSPDPDQEGGASQRTTAAGNPRMMRPISGEDFRQWSDQLRDVEQMLDDPDLRAEASRIRDQAREIRKEYRQRHSAEPNWDLVQERVARPLAQLQDKVAEEILRRTSADAIVPLDRDPVPAEYQEAVRKYYQRLGVGQ